DELEQAPVRVAEVHMAARPARSRITLERPDRLDTVRCQMLDGLLDRPRPDEAEVAVARLDRALCVQSLEARPVHVQLPRAESVVAEVRVLLVDASSQDVAVEPVRSLPVRHRDHAMVA